MTKVFVHGNPETSAIWGPLVDELGIRGVNDVVLVSPPGFGAPTPHGWGATPNEYRQWLTEELRKIGGPIDLVGHDWGAGHVFGVLANEPQMVRSWATDCVGLLHPDYVWHDAAQGWQTPEVGEAMVQGMVDMPDEQFVDAFSALGMTPLIAGAVKSGIDAEMARCILALYRTAAQPTMSSLGEKVVTMAPENGLAIVATEDHFAGSPEMVEHIAELCGADVARLPGLGHWWMIQDPEAAAEILIDHWDSVSS
jgi:pimeloyl-ACP methyl ester carboxylesterase